MLRIAVCDDEKSQLTAIRDMLESIADGHEKPEIMLFSSSVELLNKVIMYGGYDLYILDMIMPGMDGIKLGEQLRRAESNGLIVYLTTSAEFAVDSYRVGAFSYLLKPVKPRRFNEVIRQAFDQIALKNACSVVLRTKSGFVKTPLSDIVLAELSRRAVRYEMLGGQALESPTLRGTFKSEIEPLLAHSSFVLCGASLAVNLSHIKTLSDGAAVLSDGRAVRLPRSAWALVKKRWLDYWI